MELTVYIILFIVLAILAISFGRPFYHGAPFAPTNKKAVDFMVNLAKVKPGEHACDIGSGDGRLVVALARAGAKTDGIEINPLLVIWSNQRIIKAELKDVAHVYRKNLWKTDFSQYDVVTLFGIPYIMKRLEEKLLKELKPGARVVSNNFKFPSWKPVTRENSVYLYVR